MKRSAVTENIVLPENTGGSRSAIFRTLGILLRVFSAFLFAYGTSRFVFDSAGVSLPFGFVLIMCAVLTFVMWLMSLSKKLFLAGGLIFLCGAAYYAASVKSIVTAGYLMWAVAVNNILYRIRDCGYRVNGGFKTDDILNDLGVGEEYILTVLAVFVMAVICAAAVLCIARRARPGLLLIFCAPFAVAIHFFSMCRDNFGFALMLVSIASAAAMGTYDNVFANKRRVSKLLLTDKRSFDSRRELKYTLERSSAVGGFVGASAALLAALVIAVPLGIDKEMPEMPRTAAVFNSLKGITGEFVRGEQAAPSGTFFVSRGTNDDERDTSFAKREFSGEAVFDVQTDVNMPVYLRAWTGIDYDDDSWHTVSSARLKEYRKTFGTGFTPELLTYELLSIIDAELTERPDNGVPHAHTEFGYISSRVHIKKLTDTKNTVFLPSYTDQKRRLILYGRNRSHFADYANYFDGIASSNTINLTEAYSVCAYLGLPPTEDNIDNLGLLVYYYSNEYYLVGRMRERLSVGADEADIQSLYEKLIKNYEPEYPDGTYNEKTGELITKDGSYTFPTGERSLSYRYAYTMSEDERLRVHAVMDNLPIYYDFVYDNYLTTCENAARFKSLVLSITDADGSAELRRRAATFDGRHEIVTAVIDYLSRSMTYTLDPKEPSEWRTYVNSADTFLFDTKEGYCVHYATAAAMLLRAAGIPCRYADGYVATGFEGTDEDGVGAYGTIVRDKHAHAWIEVYYDYYGWVTYEATKPYISDVIPELPVDTSEVTEDVTETTEMAETTEPADTRHEDTGAELTETDPLDTAPITETAVPDDGKTDAKKSIHIPVGVIIAAAIVTAVAVFAVVLYRRVCSAEERVKALIGTGCNPDDDTDMVDTAVRLGDVIMALLRYEHLVPNVGELLYDFARRVDAGVKDNTGLPFAPVLDAVMAAEFSGTVTSAQLRKMADYAAALLHLCGTSRGKLSRLKLKYFIFVYC